MEKFKLIHVKNGHRSERVFKEKTTLEKVEKIFQKSLLTTKKGQHEFFLLRDAGYGIFVVIEQKVIINK